jgi:hypothetical protein
LDIFCAYFFANSVIIENAGFQVLAEVTAEACGKPSSAFRLLLLISCLAYPSILIT